MPSKIPAAAIWRGGPDRARIRELQEKYRSTEDGWFYERNGGTWTRGKTKGFVFGADARKVWAGRFGLERAKC